MVAEYPIGTPVMVVRSEHRSDILVGMQGWITGFHQGGYVVWSDQHHYTTLFGGGNATREGESWIPYGDLKPAPIVGEIPLKYR